MGVLGILLATWGSVALTLLLVYGGWLVIDQEAAMAPFAAEPARSWAAFVLVAGLAVTYLWEIVRVVPVSQKRFVPRYKLRREERRARRAARSWLRHA